MVISVAAALKIISPVDGRPHVPEVLPPSVPAPEFHVYYPEVSPEPPVAVAVPAPAVPIEVPAEDLSPPGPEWTSVEIGRGENLSLIFERLGLAPATLDQILSSGEEASRLQRVYPGQNLLFQIVNGRLEAIRYEPSLTELLEIVRVDDGYKSSFATRELDSRTRRAEAEITSSLFVAGQEAGLSDNLIMQLAAIFGWDIDFALDIREGDRFRVLYEERFKDGAKVNEGPILAAEFRNQGRTLRAVRYSAPDGSVGYYSDTGAAMRKEFLRTPLKFTRVSSNFNLSRKHPVLNRIRAHRGVDYAAPAGTAVKATGNGIVAFIGTKGGYGKTVALRHGGIYGTLYAHLSKFAAGLDRGDRVTQGTVIGYVGSTGLATGPHLHYEFQVNGVHRDPLTVPLPRADGIPAGELPRFQSETAPLLAELDESIPGAHRVLAMGGESGTPTER